MLLEQLADGARRRQPLKAHALQPGAQLLRTPGGSLLPQLEQRVDDRRWRRMRERVRHGPPLLQTARSGLLVALHPLVPRLPADAEPSAQLRERLVRLVDLRDELEPLVH